MQRGPELDGEPSARSVGSLEVAWTPERLTDLKRRHGYAASWGLQAHLLDPGQPRELIPLLSERILGALHVPSDIQTRATRPAEAMALQALQRLAANQMDRPLGAVTCTAMLTPRGGIKCDLTVTIPPPWSRARSRSSAARSSAT